MVAKTKPEVYVENPVILDEIREFIRDNLRPGEDRWPFVIFLLGTLDQYPNSPLRIDRRHEAYQVYNFITHFLEVVNDTVYVEELMMDLEDVFDLVPDFECYTKEELAKGISKTTE